MSGLATYPAPARPYEVVDTLVSALQADAQLIAWLNGPNVYAQRLPDPHDAIGRAVVVRETFGPPPPISHSRVRRARLQVMTWTRAEGDAHPRTLDAFHAAVHEHVRRLLTGRGTTESPVDLSHGRLSTGLRLAAAPSAVRFDADDLAYYATAEYSAALQPITPEA